MARCSAIAGSLGVHGVLALAAALAVCGRGRVQPIASQPIMIELAAPARLALPALPAPAPRATPASAGGQAATSPARPAPRHARTIAARAGTPQARALETTMQIEPATAAGGDGAGTAAGHGSGGDRGNGIGLGTGGRIDTSIDTSMLTEPLPLPNPERVPPPSRARPPRLIYPARDREVEDALTFVARLTIDSEGFVVGVRLLRGVGGGRDDQASSAVWRFRYSPALDDAGRPTPATIEQRFLVE